MKKIIFKILLAICYFTFSLANDWTENKFNIDSNGNNIVGVLSRPKNNETKTLVILMHGITSNKNNHLIKNISDSLLKNNISTIRFDFNGHGESSGKDVDMTIPKEINDAINIYNYATKIDNFSKIIFVGHSQGGLVAGLAASKLGVKKVPYLIQLAPAAVVIDLPKTGIVEGNKVFDPNNLPEKYYFGNNFYVGKNYVKTIKDLDIYGMAKKYKGNVLLIHGEADRLVPIEYSYRYKKAYKHCMLIPLENENHNFTLNEQKVIKDVINYILKII